MNKRELKIKSQILERQAGDVEYFEVAISSDGALADETSNNCDYKCVIEMVNKTRPNIIVIDPDGINSITIVRFLYDLDNYSPSAREVQRGGEFVEKYISYELIFNLKPNN